MTSPVYNVRPVPADKIKANSYNPNAVAPAEMRLLYDSIKEDGYTMPIVCYYDHEKDEYEIVDGFHRYTIMLKYKDIYERENGMMPVVVIEKDISNRTLPYSSMALIVLLSGSMINLFPSALLSILPLKIPPKA